MVKKMENKKDLLNEIKFSNRGKEKYNYSTPLAPSLSLNNKLFIKRFTSKKTGKYYYGTILNNNFYFVHIADGTVLIEGKERLTDNIYYLFNGKYEIVSNEISNDIYIGYPKTDEIIKRFDEINKKLDF